MTSKRLTTAVLATLAFAACSEFLGPEPPRGEIYLPVGIAVHPSGDYVYVVSSNFDARYRTDVGGMINVLDADTMQVLPDRTLQIASFGATAALNQASAESGTPNRLYVAVRGDDSVYVLALSPDGGTLSCPAANEDDANPALMCRVAGLPTDPFAVTALPRPEGVHPDVDSFAVASLNGEVSFVALKDFDFDNVHIDSGGAVSGANSVVYFEPTGEVWVSGRFSVRVRGIKPFYDGSDVVACPTEDGGAGGGGAGGGDNPLEAHCTSGHVAGFVVNSETFIPTTYDSAEARDLVISPGATRAYLAANRPDSVYVIDASLDDDGFARNFVIDRFDVDGGPSGMAVVREEGRDVLYVALADDDAIGVYDAEIGALIDKIAVGTLPFGMAYDPVRRRLYAALFDANAVVAIDLDPHSPTFRQVVDRTP